MCVCVFIVCICDVPSRLRGIEINSIRVAYMRARFCLTKDPTKAKRTFAPYPFKRVSVLYRRSCSIDHVFNALVFFFMIILLSLGKVNNAYIEINTF